MTALISTTGIPLSDELRGLVEDTLDFAAASKAKTTQRQYQSNWKAFAAWCERHALQSLPTDVRVVATFLTHLAKEGKTSGTITGYVSAIKYFHHRNRLPFDTADPLLAEVMNGIRRTLGTSTQGSDALLPEDLAALVSQCGANLGGMRDKALILTGFAGAFRRSEITSLQVEDIEFVNAGMVLNLRRSKTDQEGRGAEVAIPHAGNPNLCAVAAVKEWLKAASITAGSLFRPVNKAGRVSGTQMSDEAVRKIVLKLAELAGLEGKITPHSLRAGFCTAAAMKGADMERISAHARHSNIQTTLRYVRVADRFKNHAGEGIL